MRHNLQKLLIFFIIITIFFFNIISAQKLFLVLADRLTLNDLRRAIDSGKCPNISLLLLNGEIGLVTTKAIWTNSASSFLTIGAGMQSASFQVSYFSPSIIKQIIELNKGTKYKSEPGKLGDSLNRHGFKVAVIGNSDIPFLSGRNSFLIASSSMGTVDVSEVEGDFSSMGESDLGFPLLENSFIRVVNQADFIVIEIGSFFQIENTCQLNCDLYREKIVSGIDKFIGFILRFFDPFKDCLIIVSPSVSQGFLASNYKLSPIIKFGGGREAGLLFSYTTRRKGIAANIDLLPSFLNFFNVSKPNNVYGNVINSIEEENSLGKLIRLEEKQVFLEKYRRVVIKFLCFFQPGIILFSYLMIIFWKKYVHNYMNFLLYPLIFIGFIPASLLITAGFSSNNIFLFLLCVFSVNLLLSFLIFYIFRKDPMFSFLLLCLSTFILIIIDQLLGGNLIKDSFLGYSLSGASRFYGIGNEYMGILLSSSIFSLFFIFEKILKKFNVFLACLIFGISIYILGFVGLNFGGLISALVSFLLTLVLTKQIDRKSFLLVFLLIVIFVLTILFFQYFNKVPSHISIFAKLIVDIRTKDIMNLFLRKLSMNFSIMKASVWSYIFFSLVFIIIISLYFPKELYKKIVMKYQFFHEALLISLYTLPAIFILNDSGIVASATFLLFPAISLMMFMVLE